VLSGRRHSGRADRHGLPSSRQIRRPRSSRWPKRESAHAWSGGRGRDGGAGSQGQDGVAASRGVEEEEGGDVRSRGRRRRRRVPGLGGIAGGWVAVRGFGEGVDRVRWWAAAGPTSNVLPVIRFLFGTSVNRGPAPNLPQFFQYLGIENRTGTDFLRFGIFRFDFRYFSVRFRFSVFRAQPYSQGPLSCIS
jgi:hypothetical protein